MRKWCWAPCPRRMKTRRWFSGSRRKVYIENACVFIPNSSLHHQVDVCLDTFPYNGGTTTLHALWMGVPTLSLAGNTAAGRTGASILGHVGLESFLAHNREDFVRKGLFWANNLVALSEIRAGLRDNLERSVIRQPTAVAAGLEHALRTMWQRWCAKLPPESFEVTLHDVGIDVP